MPWLETQAMPQLVKKHGEAGARTGKLVKYSGRQYYFYVLDSDQGKRNHNLPPALQKEISGQNKQLAEK